MQHVQAFFEQSTREALAAGTVAELAGAVAAGLGALAVLAWGSHADQSEVDTSVKTLQRLTANGAADTLDAMQMLAEHRQVSRRRMQIRTLGNLLQLIETAKSDKLRDQFSRQYQSLASRIERKQPDGVGAVRLSIAKQI